MSRITPFQCYKLYIAIKTHFNNDKYDFFEKDGRVRANQDSFERRNDKAFFHRIAKKYDDKKFLQDFFVANFIENNATWIGDTLEDEANDVYLSWRKNIDSLGYVFREDMKTLLEKIPGRPIADLYGVEDGQHPIFFKAVLEREVSFETFTILLSIVSEKFKKEALDDKIEDEIIWPEYRRKAQKYQGFLDIENKRFREIIYDLTCQDT